MCVADTKDWIIDSGATYHICLDRELISTFKKLDCREVLMGTDQPCSIQGVGTLGFKLSNGTIKELSDVRYISAMKRNIISEGTLESLGYKIVADNGVKKILKGAMVVMKGYRRSNKLYYLDGTVVVGDVAAAECLEITSSNNSRLWHMGKSL